MVSHIRSLRNGFKAGVAIDEATKARLCTTCFRGCKALAGNFRFFKDINDFLNHPTIMTAILEEVQTLVEDSSPLGEDHSFEIEMGVPVGWSSTDDRTLYHDDVVERKNFGWRNCASALFVQNPRLPAPVTSFITIIFTLSRNQQGVPGAIIQSIYPGHDVGRLEGDMTKREGVVFFDWNHPGVEIQKVQKTRVAQAASA